LSKPKFNKNYMTTGIKIEKTANRLKIHGFTPSASVVKLFLL
jgi:hypothetical protein